MEGVFCKTSAADAPIVLENTGAIGEVAFLTKKFPSKDRATPEMEDDSEKKENLEVCVVNGSESTKNAEIPKITEPQKTSSSSPTLIGSAFKVMKNLFSPEKLKSVHSGVLSPINHQKNAAGHPCGSIYLSGKTEGFYTESAIQSGETLRPSHNPHTNEAGQIQSPLALDNLNNTDESFLTTVSLIDDSFHSAVTDFDDNGDSVKIDLKVPAVLAKSQSLDSADPCNDTLGTNESYLENTTLKIGTPEGKSGFNPSRGGSPELDKNPSFIENDDCSEIPHENELLRKEGKLNNVVNGSEEEKKDEEKEVEEPALEGTKMYEKMEMAHLFLNKSFEKSSSQQSGISVIDFNSLFPDTWKLNEKETQEKASETHLENTNNESVLGDKISTTTIVLETAREPENVSHEAGDFEIRVPSPASVGDSAPLMGTTEGTEKTATNRSLNGKEHSDPCDKWLGPAGEGILSPEENSGGCGNSPSNLVHPNKTKLNKSDELINHKISNEPAEGKNNCSIDIPLMKNVESSELSEGFVLKHQIDVGKIDKTSPVSRHGKASIASQLSYTILINHNNILNRPVVDSGSFNSPGNHAPQEKSPGKTRPSASSDASFDRTPKMKQSTPLSGGKKEKSRSSIKSPSLKLCSLELKEGGSKVANEAERNHGAKSRLPHAGMDVFPSGETPQGLSPVSPGEGKEFLYSIGNDIASDSASPKDSDDPNRSPSKTKEPSEKVRRKKGERKSPSPRKKGKSASPKKNRDAHKLNSSFDKSPTSPKSKKCKSAFAKSKIRAVELEAERTFDLAGSSPETAHLNKTYDKPGDQLNQTFDLKADGLSAQKLNETFDKKQPESTSQSKINQVVGSCQEKIAQEMNKTFDSVPIAETSESDEAGAGNQKGTKPADAPSKEAEPEPIVPPSEIKSDSSKEFESPVSSKNSISLVSSDISAALLNDDIFPSNESIDLAERQEKMDPNAKMAETINFQGMREPPPDEQAEEKLLSSLKDDKLQYDPELVQLIQEQFSSNDIEKICSVVQDFSSLKLTNDIIKAGEQFDKSFHGSTSEEADVKGGEKPLSPKSFDFLSSIGGKATGRDWSRESLYVKFDPLVQPSANSLIDFTKEGEALPPMDDSPVTLHNSSICEQLLNISPQKKAADIVPPLTPLSHKTRADENESKNERLKELQNEIYFLKNLYAEREKTNKAKMEDCESQLAKLTGDVCILEDKLKESVEREKSLVKKVQEQTQSIGQLNVIMQEYVNVISKLTSELETLRAETEKQLESLSLEKDSYVTHLQNTEAAFTDVHAKYEKSKKTIAGLKANETMFRNTIAEQGHKLEDLKAKVKEAEERAAEALQKARDDLSEARSSHVQENARLRAQLRKTELKVEALQESLDQKVKENQQLTAICDELIEGKK